LIARKKEREFNIPVIYFCQMLGLAQGLAPDEVGLHMHRIKVDKIMEMISEPNKVEIAV
jgi:heterodisulfide reductase subunit B